MNSSELVLVTGGSGFIAAHIILKLLENGYRVRATLRTISRQDEVRKMLIQGGAASLEQLSFIQADLMNDNNWAEAVSGASYVIHVASPTPATRPDDGEAMVNMAVEGVLRVLKAAKAAGVKRVVLTSASGAVLAGHRHHPEVFTEEGLELAAVNPVAVMGPVLGKDFSHSNQSILAMLSGKMPNLLKIGFDYIDARDVADLHLLAMTRPEAAGQRFLATANTNLTYKQVAEILKKNLGSPAAKVSTREIPDFLVRLLAVFMKQIRMPATFLGQNTACSNAKAKKLLGWSPRTAEEAILSTAKSMLELGIVKES